MRFLRWLWALVVLVAGVVRRPRRRERIVPAGDADTRAEWVVIGLLLAAAACAVMFVVIYALDWANQTQLLGLALGLALALCAAALIVISKRLVVTEEIEEEYEFPETGDADEQEKVAQIVGESGSRITRRRLVGAAGALAGTALGAAFLVPAASMGPVLDTRQLYSSPWHRGRRLVDERGQPYRADEIEEGTFYTAYPEHVGHEVLAAPLIVVRLAPGGLELPEDRRGWAPDGILAYSKVCTHAGCAIALYRYPLYPPAQDAPAFVCPCHYSTFDPATGGTVIYGPAGRNLPQLPLEVDDAGELRAAGDFSGPVGPSFWGVRTRRPS